MRAGLIVAYSVPPDLRKRIDEGDHPRMEVLEIAQELGAQIIDPDVIDRYGFVLRKVGSLLGAHFALALLAWRRRAEFDVLYAGNEKIGILVAALLRTAARRPRVAVLNHNLSNPRKAGPFRLFGLRTAIDALICLNDYQATFARNELSVSARKIFRVQHGAMVDGSFFSPRDTGPGETNYILSVGQESRDYETLFAAIRDSPVRMKIAASSISSKAEVERSLETEGLSNVEIYSRLSYPDLRNLYQHCAFTVLPLHSVDYPAGVTAVMESMAMGKAVIAVRSRGIQEFIEDSVNGFWVDPGDAASLRDRVLWLWNHPQAAARMGNRARASVERLVDLSCFKNELKSILVTAGLNAA